VCGSDLWPYRGIQKITQPTPMGHEYCGLVEEVGSAVKSVKPGDSWSARLPRRTTPVPIANTVTNLTFEPGARTAWHTHPLGQTLIVTSGCGWAQRWGGPIEEIRPGDVFWVAPGEKHWHGATPTMAITHIAIQEKKDGKVVYWMEQVSDEQYRSRWRTESEEVVYAVR
jgi:quercetin dioxygenase-like cupin family protein